MKVIIAGAGEVGWYIAERISHEGHDVTLIEGNTDRSREADQGLDVHVITGVAGSAPLLTKAGIAETDLFIALTGNIDTNLVSASIAKQLGARKVVARVDASQYRDHTDFNYRLHFGLDERISPQRLAAVDLASIVRNPTTLAVEHFAQGELEMQQVVVEKGTIVH